jgi:hypothetical protein
MSENAGESKRPDLVGLTAIVLTIAAHVIIKLTSDKPSVPFIGGAALFWAGYVAVRASQDRNVFRQWGFRLQNLVPTAAASAAIFCVGATAMALDAYEQGNLHFSLHALVLLAVYPIWGIVQQFLALAIVVGNLERLNGFVRAKGAIALVTAALFACLHFYDWRLAAATFAFELIVIPLYMKYRNLWPIGVLQGWFGALFYLWILHEDLLWSETLGR